MDWDAVEKVLYNMHCRACDGYQCDHSDRVAEALSELKELAAQNAMPSLAGIIHCARITRQNRKAGNAIRWKAKKGSV